MVNTPSADGIGLSGATIEACLAEIERSSALPVGVRAADAAMAVLCTLARGLPLQSADGGSAGVDPLGPAARILVHRCVVHRVTQGPPLDRMRFVQSVVEHFDQAPEDGERLVRVVLQAVRRLLPAHEAAQLGARLSPSLAPWWRAPHEASRPVSRPG